MFGHHIYKSSFRVLFQRVRPAPGVLVSRPVGSVVSLGQPETVLHPVVDPVAIRVRSHDVGTRPGPIARLQDGPLSSAVTVAAIRYAAHTRRHAVEAGVRGCGRHRRREGVVTRRPALEFAVPGGGIVLRVEPHLRKKQHRNAQSEK